MASRAVFALLLTATVIPTGLAQKASSPEQAARALQVRSIRGSVLDDTGQPLAGASVFLTPAGANPDSSSERRTVKTGDSDASMIEITEGLSEGEKILLNKPE